MIGCKCIELVKHYEGLHDGDLTKIGLQPKLCPAGIWTVGYGRALVDGKGRFLRGESGKQLAYELFPCLTEEKALEMLNEDLEIREKRLKSLKLNLSQDESDALVSFIFNIGFAKFTESTLYKYVIRNENYLNIQAAFKMWNKARVNGILKPLPGLTARRISEAELYSFGTLNFMK